MQAPCTHRVVVERILYVFILNGTVPIDTRMSLDNLRRGIPTKNHSLATLLYNIAAFFSFALRRYARWFRAHWHLSVQQPKVTGFIPSSMPGVAAIACYIDRSPSALAEARYNAGYSAAEGAARIVLIRYSPITAFSQFRSTIIKRRDFNTAL